MAIGINKTSSLAARINADKHDNKLKKSLNQLSSGLRINSAADDASGLAMSESMRSQIRSFTVAERNTFDGVSIAQTAEGAMGGMGDVLGRMRELAMQSSNGSLNDNQRGFIDAEFSQLQEELTRIQESSEFNGVSVAGSATSDISVQAGLSDSASDQITVSVGGLDMSNVVAASTGVGSAGGALAALGQIDAAIESVSTSRANVGASINRLDVAGNNIQDMRQNLVAAESRIRDADIAGAASDAAGAQIRREVGVAVQAQANMLPQQIYQLLE